MPIYGGQAIEHQFESLHRGVHIVIGTPGRLIDHLERKTLSLESVNMVVLDEADEMLDMGFTDDINKILDSVPKKPQMIFFSATFPDDMRVMMKKYLHEPHIVTIENKAMTVESTEQVYYDVDHFQKPEILCRLLDIHQIKRGLIFCNTKRMVDDLVMQLQTRGYDADGIHGDLSQAARDRVMNAFRKGRVQLLVATDVAARALMCRTSRSYSITIFPRMMKTTCTGSVGQAGPENGDVRFTCAAVTCINSKALNGLRVCDPAPTDPDQQ